MDEMVRVLEPRTPLRPLVASIPHGSPLIPERFAAQLTLDPDRLWVDAFTPELYAFLADLGAITIQAAISRFVADPNRDPSMPRFGPFWKSIVSSTTPMGEPIYRADPSADELAERVVIGHAAYHQAIDVAIARVGQLYESLLLLDLHSFGYASDADIILGDAGGKTASPAAVSFLESALTDQGFSVVRNAVYTGGWIVRRFADTHNIDAVQIELNQRCYIEAKSLDAERFPRPFDPQRVDPVANRLQRALSQALRAYEGHPDLGSTRLQP